MHRLTTDKATSDMNWMELAYNACYADSHNNARYRDYNMDMDARRLAIKLLGDLADLPNDFTCDEDFDGWMGDYLADGIDSVQGLIAVFYRNLWAMADLREKLKDYEDLEEQGKMSCTVGDKIIKKLEEIKNPLYREDGSLMGQRAFIRIDEAIEIVKQLTS